VGADEVVARREPLDDDLRSLPKAHLHLHLTGGMRRSTLRELAAERGIGLPDLLVEEFPDEWHVLGWPRFQRLYDIARGVLRTPEDIHRIVRERAEDEMTDGSRWLELQVTPSGYATRFGDVVTATEIFCSAVAAAEAATGVGVRLVVAANRTRPPWEAELLARIAVRMSPYGVVGFGLSNDERAASASEFAKAFRIAREGGLIAVPHAGELLGPASVEDAVHALHPRRLGHGVRAAEDPQVLDLMATRGIACEVSSVPGSPSSSPPTTRCCSAPGWSSSTPRCATCTGSVARTSRGSRRRPSRTRRCRRSCAARCSATSTSGAKCREGDAEGDPRVA
jgi:adenosine deaminase